MKAQRREHATLGLSLPLEGLGVASGIAWQGLTQCVPTGTAAPCPASRDHMYLTLG